MLAQFTPFGSGGSSLRLFWGFRELKDKELFPEKERGSERLTRPEPSCELTS